MTILFGCQKDSSNNKSQLTNDRPGITKIAYSYKDTVSRGFGTNPYNKLQLDGTGDVTLQITYTGNGNYQMTVHLNVPNSGLECTYTLYQNGVVYEAEGSYGSTTLTITRDLPPGSYYFTIGTPTLGTLNSRTFVIVAKPQPPSGMLCLFRYFNPTNSQHICTSDWEELGSTSQNFVYEKVLGYMSAVGSPCCGAPTLKPIYRYYDSSTGSHFETDIYGTYTGYVYEKILGYAGVTSTDNVNMSRSLTKWFNVSLDDHFVCVAPDIPQGTGYTQDKDFIFGYVQ